MEETGHYYTVYFISLSVGFKNDVARQHAFYAQMPDEVNQLDAKDLEVSYLACISSIKKRLANKKAEIRQGIGNAMAGATNEIARSMGAPYSVPYSFDVQPLCFRENTWRVLVEHSLHALTGKNAIQERLKTRQLIQSTAADNYVKIGMLLHRFGDTYAHTRLSGKTEELYKAEEDFINIRGHGHLWDFTHPDHPWERPALLKKYVEDLFGALSGVALQKASAVHLRPNGKTVSSVEVLRTFEEALREANAFINKKNTECVYLRGRLYQRNTLCEIQEEWGAQKNFANILRKKASELTGEIMDSYTPESNELLTWEAFRRKYGLTYTFEQIIENINEIKQDLTASP